MNTLQNTLDRLRADRNWNLSRKNMEKYAKTHKNKYAQRSLYHSDKAEDLDMLATHPYENRKQAKDYIAKRRDEIETNRMNDYLKNGVGKEFYED